MPITVHGPDHPMAAGAPAAPAATSVAPAATTPASVAAGGLRTNPTREIPDARGRIITWRALDALEDFDLTDIAGDSAGNQHWMMRASMAMGVRAIDGELVPRPASKDGLRVIVKRLGNEGMIAILEMWREDARLEGGAEDGVNVDRAKNLQGTPGSD